MLASLQILLFEEKIIFSIPYFEEGVDAIAYIHLHLKPVHTKDYNYTVKKNSVVFTK